MATQDILYAVSTTARAVAFTFDDGPNPHYTPQLMDIFREVGGKATFFMIGEQIDAYPEVAAAVHAEGHELANHTYTHPHLPELALDEAREELVKMDARIRAITGKPVQTFRAPYLNVNDDILSLAGELGYRCINAVNLETHDWEQPGVEHILDKTREFVKGGSILLFHDGYGDRSQSIEAVRTLVTELAAEGYQFVTVSELIALADEETN
jgi:peptidoglycan-N-acetylglucosamine deacetylase